MYFSNSFCFVLSLLCQMALKVLYSLDLLSPTAPEAVTQKNKPTHHSIWATTAHIPPSDKHIHSLTPSLPHTRLLLPIALIHTFTDRFRCHAFQNYQRLHGGLESLMFADCLPRNILYTHTPTLCHAHETNINKQSYLLIFASDNRGSQYQECSERPRRPVAKLMRIHNATPHMLWRSNAIGSVARGRSSV